MCGARQCDNVLQAVDAIVAATIRHSQRLIIDHMNKSGTVTARTGVKALQARRCQDSERHGFDKGAKAR